MKLNSSVVVTAVACLAAVLLPAPAAQAAGQRCEANASVERCASLRGSGQSILGEAGIDSLRSRVKVRLVCVALQHRTDDGWVTVSRNVPPNDGFFDGDSAATSVSCGSAGRGVYRSRGVVRWKVRGQSGTHTDAVVSRGVRKSRLCG